MTRQNRFVCFNAGVVAAVIFAGAFVVSLLYQPLQPKKPATRTASAFSLQATDANSLIIIKDVTNERALSFR